MCKHIIEETYTHVEVFNKSQLFLHSSKSSL